MRGVDYVVDETGKKKAVVIDLCQWGEVWEDFYDIMVSEARKREDRVPWDKLKAEMEEVRKTA
ncbi:MAG TPA: hypothetical protein VFI02_15275 [Armatimonadota bacterium]|nr:hypothetical protein [Armatimonadota bacterium]